MTEGPDGICLTNTCSYASRTESPAGVSLRALSDKGGDHLPITGAEVTAAARVAATVRRTLRRPEPAQVLARRKEVRAEIRENLVWPEHDEVPEVVIVNYKRYDRYGELDERILGRGASDWFKVEVKGLHDRGFEVYSAIENVVIRRGKAYRVRDESAPGAFKVYVVGRIPYERIAFIDWEPDPSYGAPRFYVVYTWRRDPYREVVLYEDGFGDHRFQVEAKYKGVGGGPIKRLRRWIGLARFQLQDRRERRRWRRER